MKCRAKIEWLLLLLLILATATRVSCAEVSQAYPDTIFAQTDSYMAVKQGEEYPFSFFFIYDTPVALEGRQVERMCLEGADGVECLNTKLQPAAPCGQYQAMSLMTDFHFHEKGKYVIESIAITFTDGNKEKYPIGRLVVEVFADEGNENLYTYVTPVMSSNCNTYTWRCFRKNATVVLADISVGVLADCKVTANRQITEPNTAHGYEQGNEVTIAFTEEMPVVYRFILPKVEVVEDGVRSIAYAKVGCYCGGLEITEEVMLKAYEAFQMKN